TGKIADINTALNGMVHRPSANFNGSDLLTLTTDDLGNTGAGGPLTDTDTVAITVRAVNDSPVVAQPIANVAVEEDAPPTILDLSTTFDDADIATNGDRLTLDVVGNSNPTLITPSLVGTTVTLRNAANQNGVASITIRATDLAGAFVDDTFTVT